MSLHRRFLQGCVIALPILIVLLAVLGSANLLAIGSLSAAELGALRTTGAAILIATVTDLVLLVGLLGWQAADSGERSGTSERNAEE